MDPRDLLRDYYAITRPKPKKGQPEQPKPKFPAIRFHDLRHSAATRLLAQGVSPRYITELLGHSQVSFTMQTYAHVLPEVQTQVATKMDEILGTDCGCYQTGSCEGCLICKPLILWCARGDSNTRPSGS